MAQTKSIAMNKDEAVDDTLEAIKLIYPGLFVQKDFGLIMLNRERRYRVGLISGGGSGHEPFPAGFVGEGMLTAGVVGRIFTGATIANILTAIANVAKLNRGGVLLISLNYTTDVLNFSAAMEIARSTGYNVEILVVSDDVSQVSQDMIGIGGRRGLVAIVLLIKILGGLSSEGKTLCEIVTVGRCVNQRLATLGATFESYYLPGKNKPLFTIGKDKVELGTGMHGEPGYSQIYMPSLKELIKEMLVKLMGYLLLEENSQIVVIVNNLGALAQMEIHIISQEVFHQLVDMKLKIERFYVGTLVTSLNTRGFQICILNVTNQLQWLTYLDEGTEAYAWPGRRIAHVIKKYPPQLQCIKLDPTVLMMDGMQLNDKYGECFRKVLYEISKTLMSECDNLNNLDRDVGDSDCGTTMRHFAEGVLRELHKLPVKNVPTTLAILSKLAESLMGGTLGSIYTLLLIGAARDCDSWATSWQAGIDMVTKYSWAKLGDRTMLDALIPAYKGFELHITENGEHSWPIGMRIALERAEEGCEATKHMIARVGRASCADQSKIKNVDPGAYAVVLIIRVLVKALVPRDEVIKRPCPI